ncbi:inositol polyphosphate-5-phosphatase A isoform b, partial [Daubentonia madagascariensis]
ALGSFYFLHESLKNIYQFDFKAKKYKKVTGKEIYSDTLESTPMLEKEKFPQDYFPECLRLGEHPSLPRCFQFSRLGNKPFGVLGHPAQGPGLCAGQELDISFPPSYPYSEDSSRAEQYMNTRCPAWCDRILMSPSAKELVLRSESEEKVVTYDHIGPNVCMGDHKPVFLAFRITPGAGKPHAHVHKCCVVQ